MPVYLGFQLLGAILGALATWASFGGPARSTAKLGAPAPAEGISDGRAFLVEAFITFLLVFVVIAVTSDRRAGSSTAAVAIGFALVSAVLIGGPSTSRRRPDLRQGHRPRHHPGLTDHCSPHQR